MSKLTAQDIVAAYYRSKGIVDPASGFTGLGQIPPDEELRRRGIIKDAPFVPPPGPVTTRVGGPQTPGSSLPSYNPAPEQPDTFRNKPFDQLSMGERIEYSYLRQKADQFRMPLGVIRYAADVSPDDIEAFQKKHKNASKDPELIRFAIATGRFRDAGGSFLHEGQLDPGDSLEAQARNDMTQVGAVTEYARSQRASLFRPVARGAMGTIATLLRATGFEDEAENFDRLADDELAAQQQNTYDSAAGTAGSMTGATVPTGAALLTGKVLMPAVMTYYAITSFGNEGQDYRKEMERRGLDGSIGEEILQSTGAMATEFLAERLGIGALRVLPDKAASKLFKEVGDGLLQNSAKKAAKAVTGYTTAAAIEGVEEGLTEFLNNTRKGLTYSPETGLWDGVPEAFAGGAVSGSVIQNANMVRRGVEGIRRDRQASRAEKQFEDRQSARIALGAMSPENAQRGLEGAEQQSQLDAQTQALQVDAENRAQTDAQATADQSGTVQPQAMPGERQAQTVTPKDIVLDRFERNPDLPKPSYLTEDGVALFDDEGASRAYASTVDGAKVNRVLGSDTWSVTNPEAMRARPVADNEAPSGDTQADSTVTDGQRRPKVSARVEQPTQTTVTPGMDESGAVRSEVVQSPQTIVPEQPELPESVAGDTSEPARSPGPEPGTRSAEADTPESGQRTGQVASAQDTTVEPWSMSLAEYRDTLKGKRVKRDGYYNRQGQIQADHRQSVQSALQLGRPVPEKAVAEYPELKREWQTRAAADARREASAVESRTEPRRTEVPPRAELAAMPFAQVRKVATELGIPEKPFRSKQKLIDAIEQRGEPQQTEEAAQEGQTDAPEFDPADMPPVVRNRLQRLGQRMIDRAEARQKARASTLYSNPIPSVLDVAAWSVGHVIRTAGDVAQFTADFKKRFGDSFDDEDIAMFHEEAKAEAEVKQVARYLKAHERKSKASTKNIVRTTTGQTDTSPEVKTTERKALRDRLKSEERATAKAYRAGAKSISETLPALLSAAREAQKLKGDTKNAVRDGIRKQIRRMVEQSIPLDRRGKFLSDLDNAKTVTNLIRSIRKMQREFARSSAAESARKIKAIAGPAALQKLDNETRDQVRKLLAESKPHEETRKAFGRGRVENKVSTDDLLTAARELDRIHGEIAEIVGYYKAMKTAFGAQTRKTRDEHVASLTGNIRASKPTVKTETGSFSADPAQSAIRRASTAISDTRLLIRTVEGKTDGSATLEDLIFSSNEGSVVYGEHKHLLQRANDLNRLNDLAVKAGWKNLTDAKNQMDLNAGRGTRQMIEVTIGGRPEKISLGEAMHIYAMDEQTRALIAAGVGTQGAGRRGKKYDLTIEDMDAIAAKLTDQQREFVDGVKAMMETNSEQAFAAVKQLKGYEPERVPGYFPRRRRTSQSENAGLPEIARDGTVTRYLENLGFTKERDHTGGPKSSPIIVGDFLTIANNHLDGLSKLSHLAVPIRNASAVLLSPEVERAITDRHGYKRYEAIKTNLAHMSRANAGQAVWFGELSAHLNTNATIAFLGANPGTWFRQLAGSVRMVPLVEAQDLAAGLKAAPGISMEQIVSESGFFWERYVGNMSGRFSSVLEGNTADVVDDRSLDIMGRGIKNLTVGDLGAAYSDARTLAQKPLEVMNWFDSFNARIAWGAMQNKVERLHPEWSAERKREWVAIEAANLVRRTQNSASPIDASHLANSMRNTGASIFTLFTSEVARARNRVYEGFQQSKAAGAAAVSAELMNIGLSALVIDGAYDALGVAMASLLSGDFDDFWERIWAAMMPDEYTPERIFGDIAGATIDPYITPRLIKAWTAWDSKLTLDGPAMDLISDSISGSKGMVKEIRDVVEGDDFETGKFLRSMEKTVNSALAGLGLNPLYAPYSKVRREMDKLEKSREDAVPSRY